MQAKLYPLDGGWLGEQEDPHGGGGDERLEAHRSFRKTGPWRWEPSLAMQAELYPRDGGGQSEQEDSLGGGGDERLEAAGTSTKRKPGLE